MKQQMRKKKTPKIESENQRKKMEEQKGKNEGNPTKKNKIKGRDKYRLR